MAGGRTPSEVLLSTVGRLDEQKGQDVLIEAMARLKNAHQVRCVIMGEGPARARLEALIRQLNVRDVIRLWGERDDASAWLAACDIFVLPSLWEGLPNALLEAMALGLPAVASNVDGVPEIVTRGRDGLLVEPKDPAALAGAIAQLVVDAPMRSALGQAARARIQERFSLPAMIANYEGAYRRVLAGRA